MRSRALGVCMAILLLLASFFAPFSRMPALAADPGLAEAVAGQILYRQNFADVSDYAKTGIRTGTGTGETAEISVKDGALNVRSVDGVRAYTLFPAVERNDSYTVEFTFRFTESGRDNGTVSYLLTCRGEEPTNITSLVIRGNGTVDDFTAPSEELRKAIAGGLWVNVILPVEDGALHRMTLSCGENRCELERSSVLVLSRGTSGFAFRNTCAAISDVWIVNGVDYEKKSGDDTSYATDADPALPQPLPKAAEPEKQKPVTGREETAPNTRDRASVYELAAAVSVGSVLVLRCGFSVRRRRRI